ncbi:MAG: Asp-tRNA(Asn)/Glu-tRNA(Gln) amidotransferase subunit GatC [Parcubacteria group bacterium]|nr:Asp-tRNA(Asn)/Glu-tRNA(Gln) amidotransferase subunit GatC [Parcubacteria group bacterium]
MTQEELQNLANLCRIDMDEKELEAIGGDIASILSYVEHISEATTDDHRAEAGVHRNIMREDVSETENGTYTENMLKAAPRTENGFVAVKNMFEKRSSK